MHWQIYCLIVATKAEGRCWHLRRVPLPWAPFPDFEPFPSFELKLWIYQMPLGPAEPQFFCLERPLEAMGDEKGCK
jgi:hypothetical protein